MTALHLHVIGPLVDQLYSKYDANGHGDGSDDEYKKYTKIQVMQHS